MGGSTPSMGALARLVDGILPWLVEIGSWGFGGLIALDLVLLAALVTVGPADVAVQLAAAAFACALPAEIAGLVLLRLTQDLQDVRLDERALQAFQEARFPDAEAYFPAEADRAPLSRRRARIALATALALAALAAALTVAGLTSSLWHVAPWIGLAFLAALALGALALALVASLSQPPPREAERVLQRREER
jgi:hypothetical protein